jgi:hypothetical protein
MTNCAGAERPEGGLCAGPAYVVTPQAKKTQKTRSIQATLYPDSVQIRPVERIQVDIGAPRLLPSTACWLPVSTMPPPDCICVAGHASKFLRLTP